MQEEQRALVERILASPAFVRSARLSAFLKYVVEQTQAGNAESITEQKIGVHAFGRPEGYNPAEDNIVRSHARLLRQKLEAYFADEGRNETLTLSMAKGAYVPSFHRRDLELQDGQPEPVADTKPKQRWWLFGLSSFALLMVVVGMTAWMGQGRSQVDKFWERMFSLEKPTLIVAADSALVLIQDLSKQRVSLNAYLSGEYRTQLKPPDGMTQETLTRIARRRYTGIVDVSLATKLVARSPRQLSDKRLMPVIRYARDLRFGELKAANAIFLGAPHANPWLEIYREKLNFWLDLDIGSGEFRVENRRPGRGEAATYETRLADPQRPVYALLASLPNLDGGGHVLLLAGASIAGTESAVEFLLDDARFGDFLAQGDGHLEFELLLETRSVDGNSPQARPVAWRFR